MEETNNVVDISIKKTKELIKSEDNLIILDVRTKKEFDEGHIEGAVQILVDNLDDNIEDIEHHKDKPVLVYCRSGRRSKIAIMILLENGFSDIYHMYEGYMNWK